MKEQVKYIEDHTKIYENYRAIREDIYQKVIGNFSDSLSSARNRISGLKNNNETLRLTADSLNQVLDSTNKNLDEITRTKNAIRVFGMEINKTAYNSIMWIILVGLVAVLVLGFLIFRRNLSLYLDTKKELKELREEFEEYRQAARKAREKMSMDHFNEIRKLKGN